MRCEMYNILQKNKYNKITKYYLLIDYKDYKDGTLIRIKIFIKFKGYVIYYSSKDNSGSLFLYPKSD